MAHGSPNFLLGLLEELDREEFETFQWSLRTNSDGKVKKAQLDGANRLKTVDVIIQTYTAGGAVKITKSTLENIGRNDLAEKCKGASPTQTMTKTNHEDKSAMEKLRSGRKMFIQGVSDANLNLLLDELLIKNVINDPEMESIGGGPSGRLRSDKARDLIDLIRRKGNEACSEFIDTLRPLEPILSEHLGL